MSILNKKIFTLVELIVVVVILVVLWIIGFVSFQDSKCTDVFCKSEKTLGSVKGYYIQWSTGLKWGTSGTGNLKWANCNNYIDCDVYSEPIWNWTIYDYPNWKSASDYPAFKYCTDKWTGWRLPTKNELFNIIILKTKNSSGYSTYLPSITNDIYWSSTESDPDTKSAQCGLMGYGSVSNTYKLDIDLYTICVHD
jgi:hypothetical protein